MALVAAPLQPILTGSRAVKPTDPFIRRVHDLRLDDTDLKLLVSITAGWCDLYHGGDFGQTIAGKDRIREQTEWGKRKFWETWRRGRDRGLLQTIRRQAGRSAITRVYVVIRKVIAPKPPPPEPKQERLIQAPEPESQCYPPGGRTSATPRGVVQTLQGHGTYRPPRAASLRGESPPRRFQQPTEIRDPKVRSAARSEAPPSPEALAAADLPAEPNDDEAARTRIRAQAAAAGITAADRAAARERGDRATDFDRIDLDPRIDLDAEPFAASGGAPARVKCERCGERQDGGLACRRCGSSLVPDEHLFRPSADYNAGGDS